tara:strand:- start:174 stop:659 length:486 start_codon:yes stop_codon:yes gene_type:complete
MSNILDKINSYNNIKNIEINKKLNIKKNYNINFDKTKKNIILTENNKKVLVGNYLFFGIYQRDTLLWVWASSIPGVNQSQIKMVNEIRSKSYLFENNDHPDAIFIYQLLTNDVVQFTDLKLFSIINKTLNFLSDSIIILNPINKTNNTQFIGISKIIEEYI